MENFPKIRKIESNRKRLIDLIMKLKVWNVKNIKLDRKYFKQLQHIMAYQLYLQYDKECSRTNGK